MSDVKALVVERARRCGFDLVGVTSAEEFAADRQAALERIREGRMDGLPWYTESRVMRGTSPAELLPGARSVICLGLSYWSDVASEREAGTARGREEPEPEPPGSERGDSKCPSTGPGEWRLDSRLRGNDGGSANDRSRGSDEDRGNDGGSGNGGGGGNGGGRGNGWGMGSGEDSGNDGGGGNGDHRRPAGRVARYAWVRDYHRVMKRRMRELVRVLERELDTEVAARWYVDDGPMLDRAAANRAGIGWFGKNTNILTPQMGSWVFLGQLITDLELESDAPLQKSCGTCVRCIDDCPTGAIVAPYVLDNARCISYLTIENRGPIPRDLRPLMGDWVFGCDICQDVCPVNRKAQGAELPIPFPEDAGQRGRVSSTAPRKGLAFLDLVNLLGMSEDEFVAQFAGTSIMRAKRVGMQRNACVALGNLGESSAIPALSRALVHGEPLVRRHAAWALGRIGGHDAGEALSQAALTEADLEVLEEIAAAREDSALLDRPRR